MNLFEFIQQNWSEILALTREHIFLVLVSTAFAVLAGVPLGILLTRIKSLQTPILGFANIMQTIPSLALFGLLIPIPLIGGVGAKTAIIALALYALLPIIRNTVTGILGIDRRVKESAVAMGMTDRQVLWQVELPLAMPVILTGIRVAVVISVGVATIAAAVGAGGLGTYIFRGLRQNDNNLLLAGGIFSAILALFADFGLGQIAKLYRPKRSENIASDRRRRFLVLSGAALVTVLIVGSFLPAVFSSFQIESSENKIVVGSKDFTENLILAEIMAQMLEKRGAAVERQFELGGTLAHRTMLTGELDVYPEYSGTSYAVILKKTPISDARKVYNEVKSEYGEKFEYVLSQPLGFANDYAILVSQETAKEKNLRTISDVVNANTKDWRIGLDQDFMSREDGYPGLKKAYNFDFAAQPREMELALTYRALDAGELDLIVGYSTDGLISALNLVQLEDDKKYFPPYEAMFVARKNAFERSSELREVFEALDGAISTKEMQKLNYEVDGNKRQPKDVARDWIAKKFPASG
ncbi:MAG: ABC transporter permease subunit [Pyrinomonadaceae bacterium]|nr:ABC transporter permease subunit [Pyrinomonadaceae bacterium]